MAWRSSNDDETVDGAQAASAPIRAAHSTTSGRYRVKDPTRQPGERKFPKGFPHLPQFHPQYFRRKDARTKSKVHPVEATWRKFRNSEDHAAIERARCSYGSRI